MAKGTNWSIKGLACASGIFCGADCLIMGVLTMAGIEFAWWNSAIFPLYQSVLPGFGPTIGGVLIGVVEGFVGAALLGALFAWLYNKCANKLG